MAETKTCKADPRHHKKQLQSSHPQAHVNCGVAATMHSIQAQTCNHKNPGYNDTRDKMGKPAGGTNPTDWERAIEAWTEKRLESGSADWEDGLRAKRNAPGKHHELRDWLEAGKGAVVGIDYGTYNATGAPTGDPNFGGYHGVYLNGFRMTKNNIPQVLSWDSLFDGRRQGIASGPTWVKWNKMRQAMDDYARACGFNQGDRFYGVLSVPGRKVMDATEPPPDCAMSRGAASLGIHLPDIRDLIMGLLDMAGEALDEGNDLALAERIRQLLPMGDHDMVVESGVTTEVPN